MDLRKEELVINGHKIVIMEQPAQYILELEKKFSDKELVGYCKEILKYPTGVNPQLEDVLKIPDEIKYKDLILSLKDKEGKKDLYKAEEIFVALGANKSNPAYVAEEFLNKLGEDINKFKYKELVEIGKEVFKQVGELIYLVQIREMFRNM